MKFNFKRLKQVRSELMLTLEQASAGIGVDIWKLWRWEHNQTKVKIEDMIKIMKFYDKPMEYFMDTDEDETLKLTLMLNKKDQVVKDLYDLIKDNVEALKNGEQDLELLRRQAN